jgi:hypothetical protein
MGAMGVATGVEMGVVVVVVAMEVVGVGVGVDEAAERQAMLPSHQLLLSSLTRECQPAAAIC